MKTNRKLLKEFLKITLDAYNPADWYEAISEDHILGSENIKSIIRSSDNEPHIISIMKAIPLLDMMCDTNLDHYDEDEHGYPFVSLRENTTFMLYDRLLTICKYMRNDLSEIDSTKVKYAHDAEKLANAVTDILAVFMSAERMTALKYRIYEFVEFHARNLFVHSVPSIYKQIMTTTTVLSKSDSKLPNSIYFDLNTGIYSGDIEIEPELHGIAMKYMSRHGLRLR